MIKKSALGLALVVGGILSSAAVFAETPTHSLRMPSLDSSDGKYLFVTKGCVICHSVNGIGGEIGPRLDTKYTLRNARNYFDFAARMWTHARGMISAQDATIGGQIDLDGQELANITAFAYDHEMQASLSGDDLPSEVVELIRQANGQ